MARMRTISVSKVYTEIYNIYERAVAANNLEIQMRALQLMAEIAREKAREKIKARTET